MAKGQTAWIAIMAAAGVAGLAVFYFLKKKECEDGGGTFRGFRCECPSGQEWDASQRRCMPTGTTPGTCPQPPDPTIIRTYFEALGCTVEYFPTTPRQVKVSYGGKSYTFVEGKDCHYVTGERLATSPAKALEVARYLGACA